MCYRNALQPRRPALRQVWPAIGLEEIERGFEVADEDGSGLLTQLEFQMVRRRRRRRQRVWPPPPRGGVPLARSRRPS